MGYTLSQDQVIALRQIGAWYKRRSEPYLTLGGYAGTGKTTLIAYLRQALRQYDEATTVAFCAYTGKATRVLQDRLRDQGVMQKGDSISTIHGLIYNSDSTPNLNFPTWTPKDKLERSLIIVDEASMVDEAIWRDLLSFRIPILAVGDHGQLPPIGSDFNLMHNPAIRLEKIFRQSLDSPIIQVATLARETGIIPVNDFGNGVTKLDQSQAETGIVVEELLQSWRSELMILCGYNNTRIKLNQAVREMRDLESPEPQTGDRVVCLRNNRRKHIFNGMVGTILHILPLNDESGSWYEVEIGFEDEGFTYSGYIWKNQFNAPTTMTDVPKAPDGERGDLWDFGYAVTVHKAQGSQAEHVLVFEERFGRSSDEDWRRWLYTAVTRAELKLTIVGPNPSPQI